MAKRKVNKRRKRKLYVNCEQKTKGYSGRGEEGGKRIKCEAGPR